MVCAKCSARVLSNPIDIISHICAHGGELLQCDTCEHVAPTAVQMLLHISIWHNQKYARSFPNDRDMSTMIKIMNELFSVGSSPRKSTSSPKKTTNSPRAQKRNASEMAGEGAASATPANITCECDACEFAVQLGHFGDHSESKELRSWLSTADLIGCY
ncbi:hypothetical protein PENTCL1PPCAC_25803 [Pristionchus entomophagus]|uniref:C2H2-type domain-containing protein n=1 Tax=Pristionchus entomophagus TaxID=358040 RepID=A0AAV5UB35_9BILA|nr:hypothetical protein PENTCL1PPCAC_25803 [Pristionchus entomophagus]